MVTAAARCPRRSPHLETHAVARYSYSLGPIWGNRWWLSKGRSSRRSEVRLSLYEGFRVWRVKIAVPGCTEVRPNLRSPCLAGVVGVSLRRHRTLAFA